MSKSKFSTSKKLRAVHRGSETSIEKMNRTNICSPPNLQNQVYFAIRLEYKDMKQLCLHLGGYIAILLKNDLKNFWKIGNDDIDDDGIWLGFVQVYVYFS